MQVKFRGKRKGGNEWLIGDLNHVNGGTYIIPTEDAPLNSPDWFEVEPSSIGMFTGLTDKNGKEIFGAIGENGGDIIGNKWEKMYVFYNSKTASFCAKFESGNIEPLVTEQGWKADLKEYKWKIIANATDNPELLEK